MRKILFKAKTEYDDGTLEWVEGHLSKCENEWVICDDEGGGSFVKEETICQFTGLTDKNGKKIWENDICRNTKTNKIVSVKWDGTMAGYVWSKRKEDSKYLYDFGELFRAYDKYEVIGNIFDNPKLMEG